MRLLKATLKEEEVNFWAKLFGTNMGLRTSLQQGNWHRGPAFIQQPLSSFHLSPHVQTGILCFLFSHYSDPEASHISAHCLHHTV